jgi:predicted nucleic acid-binding protein
MPFEYYDIKTAQPVNDEAFVFDANVWIFYHDQTNPSHRAKPYNRFLDKLLSAGDPIVILPACVLSEVMNRLLKDVYCPRFLHSPIGKQELAKTKAGADEYFKKVYRPHIQYKRDRDNIYDRIFSYTSDLRLVDDRFDLVAHVDLTTAMTDLDFTDWIIYRLADYHDRATIVTDDQDFVLENYPIITNNKTLLALMPPPPTPSKS